MKMRLKWFVVPAFALGLGACKKEAPAEKPETPAAVAPGESAPTAETPAKPTPPAAPAVSAEERAAKLGFSKYLPKNVETLITVQNGRKTADRAKSLKLWKFVEEQMGTEAMVPEPAPEEAEAADVAKAPDPAEGPAETTQPTDPAEAAPPTEPVADAAGAPAVAGEEPVASEASIVADLLGSEVTVALGDASGEQLGHVLRLSGRSNYFQIRQLTKKLIAQAKSAEEGGMSATESPFNEQMITEMLTDPEGGVGLVEKLAFPPIYFAFKADASKREETAAQISSSMGFIGSFGDFVEPVDVEKAGSKFSGYKVLGAKLSEQLASGREEMEKTIDADTLDRLFTSLAKKDIVLLSGIIGDYVVLFVGGSVDQFDLVSDAKDSLAGSDDLKFIDPFLGKDLAAVVYGEKESLESMIESAGGISDMAMGLRDGLAGEDGLGDTREIESLLQVVVEREAALRKLSRTDDLGTVAFFEEGLKIESFGGTDQGAIDWKAPTKLGHLGNSPDVVLFANVVVDKTYDKTSSELVESIFQTAYAITKKVSELPITNAELTQFKDMTKLFDEKFRTDVVGLWEAYSRDFSEGLGQETALVVDLKGTVPTIPGIPQAVADQGRFPRISVISPVVDRAKLSSSWDKVNSGATSILAKVSEMTGTDIPMQKPISSEKNGLTTWFFPMPFFNDDFMPSVTVGDQWFVASSSKTQALDLAAKASQGSDGQKGLVLKMNFVELQNYSKAMLKVIDENSASIFGDKASDFETNKEMITKLIESLDDFDSMSVSSNRDADYVRTSIHFKTR